MTPKERPPPRRDRGDGLKNERLPDRLSNKFTDCAAPSQDAGLIPRERLLYLAGRLHTLGPRPLFEFLREIDAGAPLHEHLEKYAELATVAGFIQAMDGDQLPLPKIVAGRRP